MPDKGNNQNQNKPDEKPKKVRPEPDNAIIGKCYEMLRALSNKDTTSQKNEEERSGEN